MKKAYTVLILICVCVALALPLTVLPQKPKAQANALPVIAPNAKLPAAIPLKLGDEELLLSARDYVFGVVAAEMPMSYHDEALKARAVAAYSYALYCISSAEGEIADFPHQSYITRAAAMEKWGERAEEYAARLDSITKETEGLVLEFNGAPAFAVCHTLSSGKTAAGSSIGFDKPYLISVESAGDRLSPKYRSEKSFSAVDFAEICRNAGVTLGEDKSAWLKKAENGHYTLGNKDFTTAGLQNLFSLPSPTFEFALAEDGSCRFVNLGIGNGVGMSMGGANFMALCGNSYAEILAFYFPETKIEKH